MTSRETVISLKLARNNIFAGLAYNLLLKPSGFSVICYYSPAPGESMYFLRSCFLSTEIMDYIS